MRKTLRLSALLLALCTSTFAGDIPNPSNPVPPPPAPTPLVAEPGADGDTQHGILETLQETLLSAFDSVLTLF